MTNRKRIYIFFSVLIVTILGILCKFYRGLGQEWINNYLAGVWYEVFWCLFIFGFIFHKKSIILIPVWVFIVTCTLEFLQLWHPPVLTFIRSYLLGRFLIGSTFSWWDFPNYLLGCLIGWWWLEIINIFTPKKERLS